MPFISFKVSSNLGLAHCRELMKKHENPAIPFNIPVWDQFSKRQPAIYDFHWSEEKVLYLARWRYALRKFSPSGYGKGIEMITEIEGTSDHPVFMLRTDIGEGRRMISTIVSVFVVSAIIFGIITLIATNKITIMTWLYFSILPLGLSIVFVFNYLVNALLCRRFLKQLVNPKLSKSFK
ncbi:MAG TPA: hypothetical protein VK859_13780 [bacterium]|jgi:hypothetical protein|nr:hypothetical protein [bacterium]